MGAHGFGFVEVGGVTPRPQAGNPRPRVFRLPEDGAVINRMGFPNDGAAAVEARLARKGRGEIGLGINLASNADSADPAADFVALATRFGRHADYLTLDVSCPNTANGQVFLDPARLADLLARLAAIAWPGSGRPALAAKLSPDVDDAAARAAWSRRCSPPASTASWSPTRPAPGPTACTGRTRPRPAASRARRCGPVRPRMLARVRELTEGRVPLIGVGGIASGADAYAKIRAGASAVQLYTGLIYGGTALVTRIKRDLAALLRRDGFGSVAEAAAAATPVAIR